ncbi:MAG: lysoplasmalogenase [Bacteroidia bacterium]|nr:lysoplasmalogenase [Bacteroidia bacterium]
MDKSNFTKYFLGLFLLELGLEFFHIQWAIFLVKPAVTGFIIYYFYTQSKKNVSVFSKSILIGLIASLGGDIFLMFPRYNPNFFLVGLVSFLIAHLFYIRGYFQNIKQSGHSNSFSVKVMVSNPIVLMSLAMYSLMKNDLGEMKIPVLFYMTAITCMGVMAGLRINHTSSSSWKKVLGGAILFLLSDSIIALNKFVHPFEYSNLAIMSTYYVAQFFIATGCLEHLERKATLSE